MPQAFDLNIGVFQMSPHSDYSVSLEGMTLYKGIPVESFLIFQMQIMMSQS